MIVVSIIFGTLELKFKVARISTTKSHVH